MRAGKREVNKQQGPISVNMKKRFLGGCSKMPRCKAPEILRNEAYLEVRRNDEG